MNRQAPSPPGGQHITRDGHIWLITTTDKMVERLFSDVLSWPDLIDDPRFRTRVERIANRDALNEIVAEVFLQDDSENWALRLKAAGIPGGAVRSVEKAFAAPLIAERRLISNIDHPLLGNVPCAASPLRLSLTPVADPIAAPGLGEHERGLTNQTSPMAFCRALSTIANKDPGATDLTSKPGLRSKPPSIKISVPVTKRADADAR
jgi:formyl-CoA transferase